MITEQYIAIFFGFKSELYTSKDIAYLWEESANEEYKKSKIFITALVDFNDFVSGKIETPRLGDIAFTVTSIRNPVEAISEEEYWEAFKRVVKDVKTKLGALNMTITKQKTEYYYFIE